MAFRMLYLRTDDGEQFTFPIVEYEGERWLAVADRRNKPAKGPWRPSRIICLADLETKTPPSGIKADWALKRPFDREVLEGRRLSRKPRVIPEPDIDLNNID
jgi:hypothetical protein